MPNYGLLFGEILSSAPQMSRDEAYREKINSISSQLSSLVNEIFSRFPTIIEDAGRRSAWNELVDKSRELMLYYLDLYRKNPNAPLPTKDTMLAELSIKVSDLGLKSAIELLRGVSSGTTFQGPQLTQPRTLENVPAREEEAPAQPPAARPVRRTAATIEEIQRDGYRNILDADVGGSIYRFATTNPDLDLDAMSLDKILELALASPAQFRIFTVDRRGYATREFAHDSETSEFQERDISRLRQKMESQ